MAKNKEIKVKNRGMYTTILTSVGAGLEYYDFTIYAMLAPFIGLNFFPAANSFATLINTFCIFSVGYFVRPLGGVIFGHYGDKHGRKKMLIFVMGLMAISTLLMGVLPNVNTAGYYIGLVFVICRLAQGISFGAEMPCSLTFISEHAGKSYRGVNCGIMISFVTIGVLLGSFVVYVLSVNLSKNQMFAWGWRIPFILGGLLAVAAYFVREKTSETRYFKNNNNYCDHPVRTLIVRNFNGVVKGIGIVLFPSCFILFFLAIPAYLMNIYNFAATDIYFSITVSYAFAIIILPFFGWLSDIFGRKKVLIIVLIIFILFGGFLFGLLHSESRTTLLLFMLGYQLIISAMAGSYYPLLSELFPTDVRCSGVAAVYNFSYALASLSPIAVSFIYKTFNSVYSISVFFIVFAVMSLISCFFIKEYAGKVLD